MKFLRSLWCFAVLLGLIAVQTAVAHDVEDIAKIEDAPVDERTLDVVGEATTLDRNLRWSRWYSSSSGKYKYKRGGSSSKYKYKGGRYKSSSGKYKYKGGGKYKRGGRSGKYKYKRGGRSGKYKYKGGKSRRQ